ncbi:unnamed protein product, partial [Auanema sp. JU1783]
NCDYCVTSSSCGFCHEKGDDTVGQCLPLSKSMDPNNPTTSVGFCNGNNTNYSVDPDYCKTKYTFLPIGVMVLYLICFAFGMGPMPWVFNSEIYPLWARGTCVSLATFTNWTFNLAISLTFLSLGEAIHKYGAFFLYAGCSTVGFVVFYFFVPETKGLIIEEVEELFKSPASRKTQTHMTTKT